MVILSIFISVAIAVLLVAYISHPFTASEKDLDQLIEKKVAKIKRETYKTRARVCSQCGHELKPADRFCSQCGAPVKDE